MASYYIFKWNSRQLADIMVEGLTPFINPSAAPGRRDAMRAADVLFAWLNVSLAPTLPDNAPHDVDVVMCLGAASNENFSAVFNIDGHQHVARYKYRLADPVFELDSTPFPPAVLDLWDRLPALLSPLVDRESAAIALVRWLRSRHLLPALKIAIVIEPLTAHTWFPAYQAADALWVEKNGEAITT